MSLQYVDDPYEIPDSPLTRFIQSQCGYKRKLTDNQKKKLERVVQQGKSYPSPAHLYESEPLFSEWICGIIAWADGMRDGSRKPTQSLISAIRNYERPQTGWLDFKQRKEEHESCSHQRGNQGPESAHSSQTTEQQYLDSLRRALGES